MFLQPLFISLFFVFGNLGPKQEALKPGAIYCDDGQCYGQYEGPEFIGGSDVAHQFSNTMAAAVGDQLKLLYRNGNYVKVDFSKIEMSTKGMGSGTVVYFLKIPFKAVPTACEAYTAFDHVGGWNHIPALAARRRQLAKALLPGDALSISGLKTTPEGLQEHWIQWRHKQVQADCVSQ
jgi:hypothetical protein